MLPTALSQLLVRLAIEAEHDHAPPDEDRPLDEIRLSDHEVDRFFLRLRQRTLLEHGAAPAHEVEEARRVDVRVEERPGRRIVDDVAFVDLDSALLQKPSGVAARGSGRLPIEERLGHRVLGHHCTAGSSWVN
jgi:hypothetical protein